MKKTLEVARYTLVEVYRSKVMLSILFIAIGLLIVAFVASEFAYGAPAKVALDFGFALTLISNLIMAVFIGSTLLSKEIENRTLYMILSRPISRTSFMIGKVIGLSSILIINTLILSAISVGIYSFLDGKLNSLMFWAAWFSLMEALIIMIFAILFSILTSNALAIILTISVWIVGHSLTSTSQIIFAKTNQFFDWTLKSVAFFVPDLEKLNLRDQLIYEQVISFNYFIKSQSYAMLYMLSLLILISLFFKNKNLD